MDGVASSIATESAVSSHETPNGIGQGETTSTGRQKKHAPFRKAGRTSNIPRPFHVLFNPKSLRCRLNAHATACKYNFAGGGAGANKGMTTKQQKPPPAPIPIHLSSPPWPTHRHQQQHHHRDHNLQHLNKTPPEITMLTALHCTQHHYGTEHHMTCWERAACSPFRHQLRTENLWWNNFRFLPSSPLLGWIDRKMR